MPHHLRGSCPCTKKGNTNLGRGGELTKQGAGGRGGGERGTKGNKEKEKIKQRERRKKKKRGGGEGVGGDGRRDTREGDNTK